MGFQRISLLLTAILSASASWAQSHDFKLASQPLADALRAIALQARVNVQFEPALVKGRIAPSLDTHGTVESALTAVLNGTELLYRLESKTYIVYSPNAKHLEEPADGRTVSEQTVLKPASTQQASSENKQAVDLGSEARDRNRNIPEVMVIEQRNLLNTDVARDPDDPQPFLVLDRAFIERSGATDLEELFRDRLTASTAFGSDIQSSQGLGNYVAANLRGLGSDETLILVDGRPLAQIAAGKVIRSANLKSIPIEIIERVEILPSTASAIHGANATGGVINIILRRNADGVHTRIVRSDSLHSGGSGLRGDVSAGFSFNEGVTLIMLSANYFSEGEIRAGERSFDADRVRYILSLSGSPLYHTRTPPLGSTANARTLSGENLVRDDEVQLNSPFTTAPPDYKGVASDYGAALARNAGTYNLKLPQTAQAGTQANGRERSLVGSSNVVSASATMRQQLSSTLEAFVDLWRVLNKSQFAENAVRFIDMPADAAVNPFRQAVRVVFPAYGADDSVDTRLETQRVSAGIISTLSTDWKMVLDYTWSRNNFSRVGSPELNQEAALAAMEEGTLDPFAADATYRAYLLNPPSLKDSKNTLQLAAFRLNGPVGHAPGGPLEVSAGIEHREELAAPSESVAFSSMGKMREIVGERMQRVGSVYADLIVPVVTDINQRRGARLLELQLAAHADSYSTVGAGSAVQVDEEPAPVFARHVNRGRSIDSTFAFGYKPIPSIQMRASLASGHLPPNVAQVVSDEPILADLSFLQDPVRGNEALGLVEYRAGGNAALEAERSRSTSYGLIFTPAFWDGVRVSLDRTKIEKRGNIVGLYVDQDILNMVLRDFPDRARRQGSHPNDAYSVGRIEAIDLTAVNVATQNVLAYDASLDVAIDAARWGLFSFWSNVSYLPHNRTRFSSASPEVEWAGVANRFLEDEGVGSLRYRVKAGLIWSKQDLTLAWTSQYFSAYCVTIACAPDELLASVRVPPQLYHDLLVEYRFPSRAHPEQEGARTAGVFGGMSVQIAVRNVLDEKPPFDQVGGGYSIIGDPYLARYSVTVKKSF
jgi:iron complex outermembrane recepter protein